MYCLAGGHVICHPGKKNCYVTFFFQQRAIAKTCQKFVDFKCFEWRYCVSRGFYDY